MLKIKSKLTPLRYPGGKSNALKFLDSHFVKNFTSYREPFFGGGSVGLYLMQFNKNADYWINDLFYPVYCFWKTLNEQPMTMINYILEKKNEYIVNRGEHKKKGIPTSNAENGRNLHKWCRDNINKHIELKDEFHTACLWYILNKTSFSGMAMIGSYAPLAWDQNFGDNCILKLPEVADLMHSVKSLKITNLDYSELLLPDGDQDDNTFIFLDPPYDIKDNLYGNNGDMHRGFNHQKFAEDIKKCQCNWMITYNDNDTIRSWFQQYKCLPWNLQYTMKAAKRTSKGNLVSEREKVGKKIVKFQKSSGTSGKSGKKGEELLIKNY